jgi:hypothetical protein
MQIIVQSLRLLLKFDRLITIHGDTRRVSAFFEFVLFVCNSLSMLPLPMADQYDSFLAEDVGVEDDLVQLDAHDGDQVIMGDCAFSAGQQQKGYETNCPMFA